MSVNEICPCCEMNTAGEHTWNCPNSPLQVGRIELGNIGRQTITIIKYMYFEDGQWVEHAEPPPSPVCFLCREPHKWLMCIGYGSIHDEDWICPDCLDQSIDLFEKEKKWLAKQPKVTMRTYRLVEE